MKYYTYLYPGSAPATSDNFIRHTLSEYEVIKQYLPYWLAQMSKVNRLTEEVMKNCIKLCLEDWITTNWAKETDKHGYEVPEIKDIPF